MNTTEDRFNDFQAVDVYAPPHYRGAREGVGRWCWIQKPLGTRVGILWTDDDDGLGFLPMDADDSPGARHFTPEIITSLQGAKRAGASASVVFDAWAARVTQGLAAEPTEGTDDLAALDA